MPRHSATVGIDPVTGAEKIFHRLHDGGWAYETRQDTAPILDANKEAQNHLRPDFNEGGGRMVARIPSIFIQKWMDELGIDYWNPDHEAAVNRLLDSPEYRWLRTDNSTLSNQRVTKAQIERRLAARKLWAEL